MDANEIQAITNRVTAQWLIWLQQRQPSGNASGSSLSDQERQFLNELRTYSERVLKYEDKELLEKALEHIPIHDLYEQALENDDPDASLDDKVVIRLMHWFKHDFFTWVNNPPCDFCGSSDTDEAGSAPPTEEDKRYGARFVEIYRCKVCDKITRFPRYNDPAKLLETRRGRCGEWANCFTLCCRAMGADVRLVFDKTDHVWTECYSEVKERWVHCDSGEEAYDQPLLYSEGWGKKLNYCVSFSAEEAIDVTKRYTRNWPEVLKRRTLVREDKLKKFLNDLTVERQRNTPEDRKAVLRERRKREEKELEEDSKRTNVKDGERVGRKTGSIEWRTARGETGTTVKQLLAKREDAQDFSFKNLQLVSSASGLDDGVTRLTSAKPDQVGGAYCSGQLDISEAKAAVFEFELRISDKDGQGAWDGADGMAFVIQSEGPAAIGEGGCQLGYGGLKNSVAIEFDTYQSRDRCDDPSGNHISFHAAVPPQPNSAHQRYSLGHTSKIPAMNSGQWIHVSVSLFLEDKVVDVSLKEQADENYVSVLNLNVDLTKYVKEKAWIGFTASTGGLAQNHDVRWKRAVVYRNTGMHVPAFKKYNQGVSPKQVIAWHETIDAYTHSVPSKEECHARAERTVDEWSECLKMMLKYSDPSDEFNKTIKRFVQSDVHAKNTRQALEKTSKALDQLLEKKQDILATATTLEKIQETLDFSAMVLETMQANRQ